MRVSRAERSLAVCLLLLLASSAAAQTGAPVPLYPPGAFQAPPAPSSPSPAAPASGEGDISSAPLPPVDPSWMGTLGVGDHALPRDMWSTTPRPLVDAALPLLQPTTSPTLQSLARRLLFSDAAAPRGQDPADGPSLTERRLDRVLALGYGDGAALIDALPQQKGSETLDRDSVELHVLAGDLAGACRAVTNRVARYRDPWWDQAMVGCQALNGAYDQAALGLSAMQERKTGGDVAFEALIDAIRGHRAKLDKFADPTPLRMTLLAAAKLPLPQDALATAGPAALAVWATSDKVPVTARLVAAEKAEAFGALPPAELGLVYGAVEARPEERGALLTSGKVPDDPRSRALLYDLARGNDAGPARAAALTLLLGDARRRGAFVQTARLVAPLVVELQPAPELRDFAPEAVRVLLAVGDADRAASWLDLADRAELHVLADFARGQGNEDAAPPLAAAIAALTARDPQEAPRQANLLLALAAALGAPLGTVDLTNLLRPAHSGMLPDGALWIEVQDAAKAHRLGETVLMTALLATAGDHLSSEPIILGQAIAALEAVGLDEDARALAVEAALDAGI